MLGADSRVVEHSSDISGIYGDSISFSSRSLSSSIDCCEDAAELGARKSRDWEAVWVLSKLRALDWTLENACMALDEQIRSQSDYNDEPYSVALIAVLENALARGQDAESDFLAIVQQGMHYVISADMRSVAQHILQITQARVCLVQYIEGENDDLDGMHLELLLRNAQISDVKLIYGTRLVLQRVIHMPRARRHKHQSIIVSL